MTDELFPIPDWCSWDNQGVAIALADVNRNGRSDIVVLLVDRQPGHNQGLYRIGHDLAADGEVTGGWEPWRPVPDWMSARNQGAAVAVADVTGSGRPDLLVFTVHTGPGGNQGLYRVGCDLDERGEVTGGWGPWRTVPPWFSDDAEEAFAAFASQRLTILRVASGRRELDGMPAPTSASYAVSTLDGRPGGRCGRHVDESLDGGPLHHRARRRAWRVARAVGNFLFEGLQAYGAAMFNPGYVLLYDRCSSAAGTRRRLTWVDASDLEQNRGC